MNHDMSLVPAATLSGRVTGPDGKPVAGALASIGDIGFTHLEGIESARTNADGVYTIKYAAPFDIKEYREKEAEQYRQAESSRGDMLFMMRPVLTVVHPDFAVARTTYDNIPGTQDMKLEPAAIIEGRVVYGDSGKPAVGAVVHLSKSRSTDNLPTAEESMSLYSADTRTDANEKFRFASLPPGGYDLSAEMPGWVNVGIDAFAAPAGKTSTPPNLVLTKGGLISIRLVDAKTGKPIEVPRDARAYIAAHVFPLLKISRAAWEPYAPPNAEGRFELRSPPGKRAVFVFGVQVEEAVKWSGKVSLGENGAVVVDVAEGTTVKVDIPVVEGQPPVTGTFVPAGATVLRNVEAPRETIKRLSSVLEKDPKNTEALLNRAIAWSRAGEERKAIADYEQLITLDPPQPMRSLVHNNLAFLLATSPDDGVRNGKRAVELAEKVQEMDKTPLPDMLDTLAAAYAEAGDFDRAVKTEQEAIKLAPERQLDEMRKNLKLYESNKARRETLSPSARKP